MKEAHFSETPNKMIFSIYAQKHLLYFFNSELKTLNHSIKIIIDLCLCFFLNILCAYSKKRECAQIVMSLKEYQIRISGYDRDFILPFYVYNEYLTIVQQS